MPRGRPSPLLPGVPTKQNGTLHEPRDSKPPFLPSLTAEITTDGLMDTRLKQSMRRLPAAAYCLEKGRPTFAELIMWVYRAAMQHRTSFCIDIGGQPNAILVLAQTTRMPTPLVMAAYWPFPVSGHECGASAQPWRQRI